MFLTICKNVLKFFIMSLYNAQVFIMHRSPFPWKIFVLEGQQSVNNSHNSNAFSVVPCTTNIERNISAFISRGKVKITEKYFLLSINPVYKCLLHVLQVVKQLEVC